MLVRCKKDAVESLKNRTRGSVREFVAGLRARARAPMVTIHACPREVRGGSIDLDVLQDTAHLPYATELTAHVDQRQVEASRYAELLVPCNRDLPSKLPHCI